MIHTNYPSADQNKTKLLLKVFKNITESVIFVQRIEVTKPNDKKYFLRFQNNTENTSIISHTSIETIYFNCLLMKHIHLYIHQHTYKTLNEY